MQLTPEQRSWMLVAAVALVAVVAQGANSGPWLRYERAAVQQGEIWRVLTASFVHLGWAHLALNLAGLALLRLLFAAQLRSAGFGISLLLCALVVGIGLHVGSAEVQSYVGLSGALHGLFVFGAVLMLETKSEARFALLLLGGLALKIGWEQIGGATPSSEVIGGAIIVDAHLYGAVGGLFALALRSAVRNMPRTGRAPPIGKP